MTNISIIGLGLIGGSLAKALSKDGEFHVTGCDINDDVCSLALAEGSIHDSADAKKAVMSDIVIIALYPEATAGFIEKYAKDFKKGAIVTDVCGIKRYICQKARPIAQKHGFFFVGGHPMAGREQGGYANSSADLFKGASYILTPDSPDSKEVSVMRELAEKVGSTVNIVSPDEHDRIIAFTSQLPHVLAAAYVQSPYCPKHKGFSAGSYRDVSRVAVIDDRMWSELMTINSDALSDEIGCLIKNLSEIKDVIDGKDKKGTAQLLKKGNEIKELSDK